MVLNLLIFKKNYNSVTFYQTPQIWGARKTHRTRIYIYIHIYIYIYHAHLAVLKNELKIHMKKEHGHAWKITLQQRHLNNNSVFLFASESLVSSLGKFGTRPWKTASRVWIQQLRKLSTSLRPVRVGINASEKNQVILQPTAFSHALQGQHPKIAASFSRVLLLHSLGCTVSARMMYLI